MSRVAHPLDVASEERSRPIPVSTRPRWAYGLDAVTAGGVALFAWWTLLYEVVVAIDLQTSPVVVAWLITAPLVVIPVARAHIRRATERAEAAVCTERQRPRMTPPDRVGHPKLLMAATVACAATSAVLLATTTGRLFEAGCVIGFLAMAVVMVNLRVRARARPGRAVKADSSPGIDRQASGRRAPHDLIAVVVASALAAGSMFVLRTSADDVYYVNLSAWAADHGHVPLRDTMFGPQVLPSTYGGGFPIQSIEALIGALARLLGMRAGSVTYFIVTPLCGFASIWVLWQLARMWSRRKPLQTFGYSVAFVVIGTGGAYRSYSIDGVWQGKSIAVAILLPLIWLYATHLARTRDRHWILMLLLAGVAFVGLTSTAPLLGLMLGSAIAFAAVLLRNRALLVGALALVIPTIVGGLAIAILSRRLGGVAPMAPAPWSALHVAYGARPALAMLTIAAVMLAPLLVRGIQAAVLIWCSGVLSLAVLVPGVLTLLNATTRSGPVDWRLLLSPPAPTLIGLCAAAAAAWTYRLARRAFAGRVPAARVVAAATAVSLVATFALADIPVWALTVRIAPRPSWKVDPGALANVEAILATDPSRSGPLLLPAAEMGVLAMYTTRWFAVVPRASYLTGLDEAAGATADRRTLLQLVAARPGKLSAADVGAALRRLAVTTVCLDANAATAARVVRTAGYSTFRPIGTLQCSTWLSAPPPST